MYTLKVENSKHEILELTHDERNFQITNIDGLNPVQATINRSIIAGVDGSRFNSSRLEERNIVITIKLNGDVEANRIRLYQFFKTKDWCKIYYKNSHRDVFIEGYVETIEISPFSQNETMQVSILCPQTYFKSINEIIDDISKTSSLFCFEFAIDSNDPIEFSNIDNERITNVLNDSESDTGLIIEINVLDDINKIRLINVVTGETFQLRGTFLANDLITINTNKGSKSIILTRNGVKSNIFTYMTKGSTFFQLSAGDNFYSYLVDDGANDERIHVYYKHYDTYRGV